MPAPDGATIASAMDVPGRSLKARSSEPFAPRPMPTTRRPTAVICGDGAGAGAGAAGLDRCAKPSVVMTTTNRSDRPEHTADERTRLANEVVTMRLRLLRELEGLGDAYAITD